MIDTQHAFSGFSVDNIEKAKSFYQDVLGVEVAAGPMPGVISLNATASPIFVYEKPDHQPASFTILNFPVDSVERAVDDLSRKGVKFEQYTGEMQTDARGIHAQDNMKIAWFKDPAGNYLSIIEGSM
jgi:catechol 2,3-dioxygenase-like lactoylglutathione lyase family enzyme